MDFISCLEKHLGKVAKKEMSPAQPGDVIETWANIESSRTKLRYHPQTNIDDGLKHFVEWYKKSYLALPAADKGA